MQRLGIAVAAKGVCHPHQFIGALVIDGIAGTEQVDVHIAHDEIWPAEAIVKSWISKRNSY